MHWNLFQELIVANSGLERCLGHLLGLSAVPDTEEWLRDQVDSIKISDWEQDVLDDRSGKLPLERAGKSSKEKVVFREFSVWYHLSDDDTVEPYGRFMIGDEETSVEDIINKILNMHEDNGKHWSVNNTGVVLDAVACHLRTRTKEQRYWTDYVTIYPVPATLLAEAAG